MRREVLRQFAGLTASAGLRVSFASILRPLALVESQICSQFEAIRGRDQVPRRVP